MTWIDEAPEQDPTPKPARLSKPLSSNQEVTHAHSNFLYVEIDIRQNHRTIKISLDLGRVFDES
jgi:hypothetical protein